MPSENITISLLSIFSILSFFIFLIINKFSKKIFGGLLLDVDFDKPQAFHKESVPRCGGLAAIISLMIFYVLFFLLFKESFTQYVILSILIFLLGFSEDIKFNLRPSYRLIIMILVLILYVFFFTIDIYYLDLLFLSTWMTNNIFATFFILICFLFIINGANLIDGFNGLLTIHLIIINSLLLYINLKYGHQNQVIIITAQIVVLVIFLMFNFPNAKMFLGDSGSYMFGSLVALNVINTNNLNPDVSSFYFASLLFYLFFEVFFSFFRKLYLGKSPIKPDNLHLHMLSFKFINRSNNLKNSNYLNSLIINLIYVCIILPTIFFNDNGLICRYWFFSILALYLVFYYLLYSFAKKQ
ncbi:MAG: hypothetical protein CBE07_001095 [Pelagibacteraceae bacterium TMED247]|nr:hypothetical protein [Candidatus Pelagibacter sp.]RPG05830.1 MAG: hypothetical protein CBE07_001095 [Pelagibacteraceae bacterium TMED247]